MVDCKGRFRITVPHAELGVEYASHEGTCDLSKVTNADLAIVLENARNNAKLIANKKCDGVICRGTRGKCQPEVTVVDEHWDLIKNNEICTLTCSLVIDLECKCLESPDYHW